VKTESLDDAIDRLTSVAHHNTCFQLFCVTNRMRVLWPSLNSKSTQWSNYETSPIVLNNSFHAFPLFSFVSKPLLFHD